MQAGGDDVKRIIEKVEAKIKDAKGNVQSVDWKGLASDLKKELPKEQQKYVDVSASDRTASPSGYLSYVEPCDFRGNLNSLADAPS